MFMGYRVARVPLVKAYDWLYIRSLRSSDAGDAAPLHI